MEIVFATGNQYKVVEAQKALGDSFALIMPKELGLTEDIPEDGDTLEKNAIQKAEYLWNKFGKNCFADDTGLEVDALGGAPGVYTARYAGPDKGSDANIEKLLAELSAVEAREGDISRTARFRTVVALIMNGELKTFEGVMEGEIARTRSGSEGFGYDPVFIPQGYNCTIAEISLDEKNAISHRGKAMRALAEYLNTL
ncbi:MAG: RdgB/HAM1 family non-canonical purine NTP pyrophosphatase [Bacteroidales bacterium]|nr:RdgB/HAM1 family non-canonical purine NTP pyrophosphatase [Bacteroidales bacterium]